MSSVPKPREGKMRILHISPMYFPVIGGAERHLKEISERLTARGHEVTVFTVNARDGWDLAEGRYGGFPRVEIVNGVKIIRFRPDGERWVRVLDKMLDTVPRLKGGYRYLSWLFTPEGLKQLRLNPRVFTMIPHILRFDADIVATINWHWPTAYYAYLARKLKCFTLVGIPLFETAMNWCHGTIYKSMLASCDAVLTNTRHEGQFVQERGGVRVAVASVGIDPEAFEERNGSEIRARYSINGLPVVGYVGRQVEGKGALKLLQSMKEVWRWNSDVRVLLAGPRSPSRDEMGSIIDTFTNVERERIIRIDEFAEKDKASIYDACDVFVLPSTGESFGIAYLEAWLCGKPVIGGRIGSTQCVVEEGVDGLLVDPADPEHIGRGIIELLSDRHKRETMGRRGRAKTLAQFTWEKVTDRVEKLYTELVAAKRARRLSAAESETTLG